MACFLYFLPGVDRCPSRAIDKLPDKSGLAEVLAGASWGSPDRCKGPGDVPGSLLAIEPASSRGEAARPVTYNPENQQWIKVEPEPGVITHWIGWYRDKTRCPRPADLEREEVIGGHVVKLGDGREWLIPVVHAPVTNLPQSFFPTAEGTVLRPVPQYQSLMDETARWYTLWSEGGGYIFSEAFDFCCRLLAVNYRVEARVCYGDALDLVRTEHVEPMIEVAVGAASVREQIAAQKKSE